MRAQMASGEVADFPFFIILGNGILARLIEADAQSLGLETLLISNADELSLSELAEALAVVVLKKQEACVHPAGSYWSSRPELSSLCSELGFHLISAISKHLTLFSNKLSFLQTTEKYGFPNLLLSQEVLQTPKEILKACGPSFPFVIRSVKQFNRMTGVKAVHSIEEFDREVPLWIRQVTKNEREALFFIERYLHECRYWALPFCRTERGVVRFFSGVDASLQLFHRKLIEFCPIIDSDPSFLSSIQSKIEKFLQSERFVGMGVFEFLISGDRFYLVDGWSGLTPIYRTWELQENISALEAELSCYGFYPDWKLKSDQKKSSKKVISLRVFSEDPVYRLPQPGWVDALDADEDTDLCVSIGERVKHDSDGLLAILHASADDFTTLLENAKKALHSFWISGSLRTNERFLEEVLSHPWVKEGIFHTAFLEEDFIPEISYSTEISQLACVLCESVQTLLQRNSPQVLFYVIQNQKVETASLEQIKIEWVNPLAKKSQAHFYFEGTIRFSSKVVRVSVTRTETERYIVKIGKMNFNLRAVRAGDSQKNQIFSLVDGKIHSLLYQSGATVPAHKAVLIVESLGQLVPHALPKESVVLEWCVKAEQEVLMGQCLAKLGLVN